MQKGWRHRQIEQRKIALVCGLMKEKNLSPNLTDVIILEKQPVKKHSHSQYHCQNAVLTRREKKEEIKRPQMSGQVTGTSITEQVNIQQLEKVDEKNNHKVWIHTSQQTDSAKFKKNKLLFDHSKEKTLTRPCKMASEIPFC